MNGFFLSPGAERRQPLGQVLGLGEMSKGESLVKTLAGFYNGFAIPPPEFPLFWVIRRPSGARKAC